MWTQHIITTVKILLPSHINTFFTQLFRSPGICNPFPPLGLPALIPFLNWFQFLRMVSEFFYFGYVIASCSSVNSWLFRRPSSLLPVFPSSLLSRNCSVLGVGFSLLFISWIVWNVFLSKVYMKGKLWSLIGLKIPFFVPHALMLGNSSVKIYPRTWTILLALTIIWWEVWCLSDSFFFF